MPVKLGSIIVPWAGEWIPSSHYPLTGIWNPNFRSDHKGRGLPECPVQTLQWAPTHSMPPAGLTTGCGCYQSRGSTWASPSAHMLIHFIALPLSVPGGSHHKQSQALSPRFLSHLTLGKSRVHDLRRPTFYSGSAPPWRIHSSTLLGRTFNKTLSALSLHCSEYV